MANKDDRAPEGFREFLFALNSWTNDSAILCIASCASSAKRAEIDDL